MASSGEQASESTSVFASATRWLFGNGSIEQDNEKQQVSQTDVNASEVLQAATQWLDREKSTMGDSEKVTKDDSYLPKRGPRASFAQNKSMSERSFSSHSIRKDAQEQPTCTRSTSLLKAAPTPQEQQLTTSYTVSGLLKVDSMQDEPTMSCTVSGLLKADSTQDNEPAMSCTVSCLLKASPIQEEEASSCTVSSMHRSDSSSNLVSLAHESTLPEQSCARKRSRDTGADNGNNSILDSIEELGHRLKRACLNATFRRTTRKEPSDERSITESEDDILPEEDAAINGEVTPPIQPSPPRQPPCRSDFCKAASWRSLGTGRSISFHENPHVTSSHSLGTGVLENNGLQLHVSPQRNSIQTEQTTPDLNRSLDEIESDDESMFLDNTDKDELLQCLSRKKRRGLRRNISSKSLATGVIEENGEMEA